jgi:hypothetical protein
VACSRVTFTFTFSFELFEEKCHYSFRIKILLLVDKYFRKLRGLDYKLEVAISRFYGWGNFNSGGRNTGCKFMKDVGIVCNTATMLRER